jgi:GT2 family glycosyltransferase
MHDMRVEITPQVGVALVNWNGGEYTIPCIRSLLAGTVKPTLIIVVDNASQDGSPEQITAAFPQIVMIRNQRNEGFAGANNQAIAYLLAQNVEYIWVLNNDTTVAPDCLETLIRVAGTHPVAGYSAKIYYETPPDRIWYAGAHRHPWHCAPKHELTLKMESLAVDGAVAVDFISGCSIFTPADILYRYGAFNTGYIAYSEDSDWCWRVQRAGLPLYFVPGAVLWHHLSASLRKNTANGRSDEITPFAARLMVRNHLWTVRTHLQHRARRWFHLVVNLAIQVRNIILSTLRGNWPFAQATLQGLWEGLTCKVPVDIPQWKDPSR